MKSKPTGIESIAIRRAVIADSDKVRYRVYSTPTEFIAVIAESALMAVKVSGVSKPHKIVRDLPTEGIAVEAKKMAAIDPTALRITLPTERTEKQEQLITELAAEGKPPIETLFKPMNIADLQHNGTPRARILPPEMLSEIIEQHSKAHMPHAESPEPVAEASEHHDIQEIEPLAEIAQLPPEPELSPEEKLLQMAQETLAPATTTDIRPATNGELSPEEVEKLLNG